MRNTLLAVVSAVALTLGGCSNQSGEPTPAALNANPAAQDDASQMPGGLPHYVGTFENQAAARDQAEKDDQGAPVGSGTSAPPANGLISPGPH